MKTEAEDEAVGVSCVALESAGSTGAVERWVVGFSCVALESAGNTGAVERWTVGFSCVALETAGNTGAVDNHRWHLNHGVINTFRATITIRVVGARRNFANT